MQENILLLYVSDFPEVCLPATNTLLMRCVHSSNVNWEINKIISAGERVRALHIKFYKHNKREASLIHWEA